MRTIHLIFIVLIACSDFTGGGGLCGCSPAPPDPDTITTDTYVQLTESFCLNQNDTIILMSGTLKTVVYSLDGGFVTGNYNARSNYELDITAFGEVVDTLFVIDYLEDGTNSIDTTGTNVDHVLWFGNNGDSYYGYQTDDTLTFMFNVFNRIDSLDCVPESIRFIRINSISEPYSNLNF